MKSFRSLFLLIVSILGLILLTGLILSLTYEEAVIKYLKKYLDKHLTTKVEVTQIRLSFIRKFPNATVELRNMVIYSGTGYHNKEFSNINTDTLLSAKSVFFEFSLPGVIKNEYKLKNIRIIDGKFLLLRDSRKNSNFNIWEGTKSKEQEESAFTLQNIILSNTEIKYLDLPNKAKFDAETKRLFIRADLKHTENLISSNGYLNLHHVSIGNSFEVSDKKIGIDLNMNYHEKHFTFYQSSFHSGKCTVNFDGEIDNTENILLALNLHTNNASIRELEEFFTFKLAKIRDNYSLTDGVLDLNATISGVVSSHMNPKINVLFNVRNASVMNQNNRKKISGISLDGDFSNGSERNKNTATLGIKKFTANQGKSLLKGALKIKGLDGSNIELIFSSEIQVDEMADFLNADASEYFSGSIAADVYLKGYLSSLKKIDRNELISFKKEGIISFKDAAFKPKNAKLVFRKINGKLILEDIIKLRDFSFMISNNDFRLDGNLINLPQYLFNKESLSVDARIKSEYLDIRSLVSASGSDTIRSSFSFPDKIILRSDFSIDRLIYGKFIADSIVGFVSYKPRIFHFENFELHSVDGFISGNATVAQSSERKISINCHSKLGKLDIQKLFYSTNNFGQHVIMDNNIMGELSGELNFTSEWDEHFRLNDSNVIANSDIEIKNGQLINYEPMLALSRFVNVDELKDIKFSTLRNQIFIMNRKVVIPEMDIHSSAFHIKGSGTHYFSNSYDYRIQVELNELLSNKAKKRRKEIEEFGTIEDDGLGRLNFPIKITGRTNEYHVEFDRKRAVSTFRSNITSEKEEIKNLFRHTETEDNIQNLPDSQNKNFIIDWDNGNEKKDFKFEKNDQKEKEQPLFIIEWDEDENTENRDTANF